MVFEIKRRSAKRRKLMCSIHVLSYICTYKWKERNNDKISFVKKEKEKEKRLFLTQRITLPPPPTLIIFYFRSGRAGHDRIDSQALNATSMYHSDPLIPGWCFAQPNSGGQPLATCDCLYEGRDGFLCETPTAQFCLGGCNNRGECDSGYCKVPIPYTLTPLCRIDICCIELSL